MTQQGFQAMTSKKKLDRLEAVVTEESDWGKRRWLRRPTGTPLSCQ